MRIRFLGTGTSQGVPVIACECPVCTSSDPRDNRLRTSALIETKNITLSIDCGPDFRQQMLREKIQKLDGILLTHAHRDHMGGLDDVRAYNFKWDKDMEVYGNSIALEQIQQEFPYIFIKSDYGGAPRVNLNFIDGPFELGGEKVIPIPVIHHKLDVLGFRIGDFAYITDANIIPDSSMELLKGVKTLVLNALRRRAHKSHFSLSEALEIVNKLNPEKAFFTHISHYLGKHGEVEMELPENVTLAYDGLILDL